MNTSLEDDIRQAFERQAAQTTIDPDPEFGVRPIRAEATPVRSRRRFLVPAIAAAAVLATAGGLVAIAQLRSDPATPLAEPTPVDASATAIGLFPMGDAAAVSAAGYATPRSAVGAYLADRTRSEVVPDDYDPTYSVFDRVVRTGDDLAVVGFSLGTENDVGDGLLLVRQVAPPRDPERWVVLSGGIATFAIEELVYDNGTLTGSFSNDAGGRTDISVYDAVTGERLASTNDGPFTLDGLTASAVSVRFWNTVADGGYPIAVFAEALVHDGEAVRGIGRSALADAYYSSTES